MVKLEQRLRGFSPVDWVAATVSVAGQSITSPEQFKQTVQRQSQASRSDVTVTVRREDRNRRVTLDPDRGNNQQANRSQTDNNRDDYSQTDARRANRRGNGSPQTDRRLAGNDQANRGQDERFQTYQGQIDPRSAQRRSDASREQYGQNESRTTEGQGYLGVRLDTRAEGQGQGVRIASQADSRERVKARRELTWRAF